MAPSRPQIKLPHNPYDAAWVIAKRIFEWNLEDHNRLLVTNGLGDESRFLPKGHLDWQQTPQHAGTFEGQFYFLTYQPGRLEGQWLSLPWHTLDEYNQKHLHRHQLEYVLWSIADWDTSEYPHYHERGLLPPVVLSYLEDGSVLHFDKLSIWKYILPAFRDEAEFQEWTNKYPAMPQFHTQPQTPQTP